MKFKSVFLKLTLLMTFAVAALALSSCLMPKFNCRCAPSDDDSDEGYGLTYTFKESENKDGEDGYYLTEVGYKEVEVSIPETYMGLPVIGISAGAFVHYIPPVACSGGYEVAVNVKTLTIPNSIKVIEYGAFMEGRGADKIIYKGTVEEWCSITFGSTPIEKGTKLYIGGKLVTDLVVPCSVETVSARAFENYSYLESLTFEDGVNTIGSFAFKNCTELLTVIVPSTMQVINHNAFSNCYSLVEVYNLSSLDIQQGSSAYGEIGYNALVVYTSFDEESALKTVNDYIFITAPSGNYLLKYKGDGGAIVLPDDIEGQSYEIRYNTFIDNNDITAVTLGRMCTKVGESAFNGCRNLEAVYGGDNIVEVGKNAFYYCNNLKSIAAENIEKIGENAFYNCNTLSSIDLKKAKELGEAAFAYCNKITEVDLSALNADGLKESCFNGCILLSKVILPENISAIPKYAFSACYELKDINLPAETECAIGERAFSYCNSFESLTLTSNLTVARSAFSDCAGLKSVEINFARIERETFGGCDLLQNVTLNEGVEYVDLSAFKFTEVQNLAFPKTCVNIYISSQPRLSEFSVAEGNPVYVCKDNCLIKLGEEGNIVVLGNENSVIPTDGSVTAIGGYAFADCKFEYIELPSSVTKLYSHAFYASSVKGIDLSNVTYIGSMALGYCRSLTRVVLGGGLTEIDYAAFEHCESLSSITLPSSLKKIGSNAFAYTALTSIEIPEKITEIPNGCFIHCENLREITLPAGIVNLAQNALYYTDDSGLTVHYNGTKEQWVNLGLYFPYGPKAVYCIDGKYER